MLHVVAVLAFNFVVLRDIEIMAGWLRTSIIFSISGIGGNLWSAILIPYEPEVCLHLFPVGSVEIMKFNLIEPASS